MAKYGVFILRGQPPHMGHQAIVNEILLDGRIPILILGSSNVDRDLERNPLGFGRRVELWKLIYPDTNIIFIKSNNAANEAWYTEILENLKLHNVKISDTTLYYHNKEEDRYSFSYKSRDYIDMHYTQIFEDENWNMQKVAFANRSDIKIEANAKDIRHNLEAFKHLLDGRVYHKLKRWGTFDSLIQI